MRTWAGKLPDLNVNSPGKASLRKWAHTGAGGQGGHPHPFTYWLLITVEPSGCNRDPVAYDQTFTTGLY